LNKNTGKMLWIRSYPPFIAVTAEEKKANPGWKAVADLVGQLEVVNSEFVKSGWSQDLYKKKYDLQKQINARTDGIDKKYALPRDMYLESWTGYTAPTPCSDGKNIYLNSGDGVTACYDLEGKCKWAKYESLAPVWGEHGYFSSPTVAGNVFVAPSLLLRGLDTETGAEIWKQNVWWSNNWAAEPFNLDGTDFVMYGGKCLRVKDGKVFNVPDAIGTPVVVDKMAYFGGGCYALFYKLESGPNGEMSAKPLVAEEYNRIKFAVSDNPALKVDPTIAGFGSAAPLYDKGLLYLLGNFGWLRVLDVTKTRNNDTMVYGNCPAFDLKLGYQRKTAGMGIGASPILAGKQIYLSDSAGCTVVIEPGREYKQIAKNNIDHTMTVDWEPGYGSVPRHEQFEASMIADGNRLYLRGEQNLYCVGER
jgi:hypothetical protein